MEIYMKAKSDIYNAFAIYDNGKIVILKNSKIRIEYFSESIRGGKTAHSLRQLSDVVNEKGIVQKDIVFNSPSTAAQFVSGRSTNGLVAWKLKSSNITLKEYLNK